MLAAWINVYATAGGKQYLARPCGSQSEADRLLQSDPFLARPAFRLRVHLKGQ